MCDKELFERKIMDLQEYRTAIRERMRAEENLAQYIEAKKSPKAAGGGGSAAGGSDLSRYMEREEELREELLQIMEETERIKKEKLRKIAQIESEDEKDVLIKKYIYFKPIKEIALEMGHSRQHIWRIHREAIMHYKIDV